MRLEPSKDHTTTQTIQPLGTQCSPERVIAHELHLQEKFAKPFAESSEGPPWQSSSPYFFASCMSRQIFSGLKGISRCVTPNGARASMMAFATAGPAPMVPASPQPLAPRGLTGVGVTVRSVSRVGTMGALGMA